MKTFQEFTDIDSARLLHQLFPDEIPALLDFMEGIGSTIKDEEQRNRKNWDNAFYDFDFWLSLIETIQIRIKQHGAKLREDSKLFADSVFGGYQALFARHCITLFVTIRKHPNQSFVKAIKLLFNL